LVQPEEKSRMTDGKTPAAVTKMQMMASRRSSSNCRIQSKKVACEMGLFLVNFDAGRPWSAGTAADEGVERLSWTASAGKALEATTSPPTPAASTRCEVSGSLVDALFYSRSV